MSAQSLRLIQPLASPQDAQRRAKLLNYFCRALFAITVLWGLAEGALYLSGNLGRGWHPSFAVIGDLLLTVLVCYWQLRRHSWQSATSWFLIGIIAAIAVAEWYFVQQIPEVASR